MYGPETITMRGLQSETFAYYVHIYTNDVCWNKISANVKIYQASTGGLLHSIQQPDCSESKSFLFVSQRDSLKLPGGLLLGILGGGVPPDSPNPNPISDQNLSFFTPVPRPGPKNPYPFSDLASKKLRHHYLDQNSIKKDFLTSISNSHIPLSFLPIPVLNGQSGYPFSYQTAQKPNPLGQHIPPWLI